MKITPKEVKADGLKLFAEINGMQMPLSDDMMKHYCGHLPKSEMEAKVMARRLKGKRLDFPNINMGSETKQDKREERIARRKRRERNVMKVNLGVKLDDDVKKHELSAKLMEIEGVKKVKKISDSGIELEIERKMSQKDINEKIVKLLEEDYEGIKELSSIDYHD